MSISHELHIFEKLSWDNKIQYISGFYQGMIKKTDNPGFISKFQSKIDEVEGYRENEENTSKLIDLYARIMGAKEKTKQRKLEETKKAIEGNKEQLVRIESNENEQDPDEYLAEAMAKIG